MLCEIIIAFLSYFIAPVQFNFKLCGRSSRSIYKIIFLNTWNWTLCILIRYGFAYFFFCHSTITINICVVCVFDDRMFYVLGVLVDKGNNKITELRTILPRESQNSQVYKQTKSVNKRKTVKTVMTLTWYRHF